MNPLTLMEGRHKARGMRSVTCFISHMCSTAAPMRRMNPPWDGASGRLRPCTATGCIGPWSCVSLHQDGLRYKYKRTLPLPSYSECAVPNGPEQRGGWPHGR